MKIGIFLGYGPNVHLGKEGLGRYLGTLIKNLQKADIKVVVAFPAWLSDTLEELVDDFEIDLQKLEKIETNRIPIIWKIYNKFGKKKKKKRKKRIKKIISRSVTNIIDNLLTVTSTVALMFFLVIGLLLALVAIPFVIVVSLLLFLYLIARKMKNKSTHVIKRAGSELLNMYQGIGESGLNSMAQIYDGLIQSVQKSLVKQINQCKDIDLWYSPGIFWPVFNSIDAPRVINVPDLVTKDFAMSWGDNKEVLYSTHQCEKTIEEGDYFITYCSYIKDSLLIKQFGVEDQNITAIPHSMNDLGKLINVDTSIVCDEDKMTSFVESYCKNVISSLKPYIRGTKKAYIKDFVFDDVDYIFYSSQGRPHKNILNLIKAYEYLLRKRYIRTKLFMTCDINTMPDVREYISEHRLQYDVICFYNVPVKGLAALYHQARLVVNPTLYEGGFPFTFGEGMSVHTPSVMSDIPQVREVLEPFGLEEFMFDPYDISDMANKIEKALMDTEKVYEKELPLYQWLCEEYSPEKVGDLYVETFKRYLDMYNRNRAIVS
ncbi:MAG: glycosyltransferase [Lachnospiraceae bacterium]